MSNADTTIGLLTRLAQSKRNLVDTLVSKGEEADINEPFDDLVQKAADYIPKTYILVDEDGNEVTATLVDQETVFDATVNDVREGKVFATETGVKTGEKVIPSYHTSEGYRLITSGQKFETMSFAAQELYDFTKLQVIICPYAGSIAQSVAAEKVAINDEVYAVNSTALVATVTKDSNTKKIDLGIVNETDIPYVLRYFTYKEIY